MQRHIVQNALLHIAFSAILPAGITIRTKIRFIMLHHLRKKLFSNSINLCFNFPAYDKCVPYIILFKDPVPMFCCFFLFLSLP